MAVVEHRLRVMASEVHLILVDPSPGAADYADLRLHELEQWWSRFLPDSDIARIGSADGQWLPISGDTFVLIETMQRASTETGGRYDPTLMHELLAAGYTTSFEDPTRISVTIDAPCMGLSVHDIVLDRPSMHVWVPPGLALDPGGIGKGLAADIVVAELQAAGTVGAMVSIGGDLFAAGRPPTSAGWQVAIEDPHYTHRDLLTMGFDGGGVATSSIRSRRWLQDGVSHHHLIDPITRASSMTDLAAVTVVASSGWQAEAHATAAILDGSNGLVDYLNAHGLSGMGTLLDGTSLATADLQPLKGVNA